MPDQYSNRPPNLPGMLATYRQGLQTEGFLFHHLVKYADDYPLEEIWKQLTERERCGMRNFLTLLSFEDHQKLIHLPIGPDLISQETMALWNRFIEKLTPVPHDFRDWMVGAGSWVDPDFVWHEKLSQVQREEIRKYVEHAEAYYRSQPQTPEVLGNMAGFDRWRQFFTELDDPEYAKHYLLE